MNVEGIATKGRDALPADRLSSNLRPHITGFGTNSGNALDDIIRPDSVEKLQRQLSAAIFDFPAPVSRMNDSRFAFRTKGLLLKFGIQVLVGEFFNRIALRAAAPRLFQIS